MNNINNNYNRYNNTNNLYQNNQSNIQKRYNNEVYNNSFNYKQHKDYLDEEIKNYYIDLECEDEEEVYDENEEVINELKYAGKNISKILLFAGGIVFLFFSFATFMKTINMENEKAEENYFEDKEENENNNANHTYTGIKYGADAFDNYIFSDEFLICGHAMTLTTTTIDDMIRDFGNKYEYNYENSSNVALYEKDKYFDNNNGTINDIVVCVYDFEDFVLKFRFKDFESETQNLDISKKDKMTLKLCGFECLLKEDSKFDDADLIGLITFNLGNNVTERSTAYDIHKILGDCENYRHNWDNESIVYEYILNNSSISCWQNTKISKCFFGIRYDCISL